MNERGTSLSQLPGGANVECDMVPGAGVDEPLEDDVCEDEEYVANNRGPRSMPARVRSYDYDEEDYYERLGSKQGWMSLLFNMTVSSAKEPLLVAAIVLLVNMDFGAKAVSNYIMVFDQVGRPTVMYQLAKAILVGIVFFVSRRMIT